ncbi:VRR-NUC domain-containing protein [Mesorhizobium sp. M00.F.Ca.ET.217.01.1.1]|uniref:VRR-NUC domain-containing protein n=1 Tax=Mesorhizobium sp. M00.F.Ca.ET.217.01.1.1 TaxID=2500529 RepID=UPI000FDB067A|nr:VRR-NUC domain-containing protein [Mesorhizobium sp. M00.F.Ca.ET.217.01.1.1]TGQ19307.1 VRR-NUC domain-containing protein [Mesorhizobium sp. M00.F.Ca.ET.217.01.1.1]
MTKVTKTTTQTVRIGGKRMRLVTRNGKVTVSAAMPLEWELQAAQVRRLRGMPEYALEARQAGPGKFTLAGDQNAAKRGPQARMQAQAAGLTPGEHDVRIYMFGGRLGLIENKVGEAKLEPSQKARHPLLAALGFTMQEVVRATSCDEAADKAEAIVRRWLAANDNERVEENYRSRTLPKAA